jgi:2-keto-4-pentenoate hydratase
MQARYEEVAARLRAAYRQGAVAPLRDALDPNDADGAYAVQSINTSFWQQSGRRVVGWKIGLTAVAVQKQLGVDQPDFGVLFDDMEIADGGTLRAGVVLQPKAEAEIALVMGRDIENPEGSMQDVMAAVAYALPAIEIVDSRIADWQISFADTVADNGSAAFFVLGTERRALAGLDLWSCGMVLEVNGQIASLGAGAACLGHPLHAAAWLVRRLAQAREGLREGDIVLTGALGPMVAIKSGDTVRASIGGVGGCGFRYAIDDADRRKQDVLF